MSSATTRKLTACSDFPESQVLGNFLVELGIG